MNIKRLILNIFLTIFLLVSVTGCETREADVASYNLSLEADNFNVIRQLTVINCVTNEIQFQMTGKLSIESDNTDNQLEVIVEMEDGTYRKHFIGLADNVDYIVEDLGGADISQYKYTLNFNPNMIIPYDVKTVD